MSDGRPVKSARKKARKPETSPRHLIDFSMAPTFPTVVDNNGTVTAKFFKMWYRLVDKEDYQEFEYNELFTIYNWVGFRDEKENETLTALLETNKDLNGGHDLINSALETWVPEGKLV